MRTKVKVFGSVVLSLLLLSLVGCAGKKGSGNDRCRGIELRRKRSRVAAAIAPLGRVHSTPHLCRRFSSGRS